MKRYIFIWLATTVLLLLGPSILSGQNFTETFEDETAGTSIFSGGGVTFTTNSDIEIGEFTNGGSTGVGDHQFLEAAGTSGSTGEVIMDTPNRVFQMKTLDIWLS